MNTFADRIRSFRKNASTAEFARFLGISSGSLNNYERGVGVPSGKTLIQISERLGVKMEWLLHGVEAAEEKGATALADVKGDHQTPSCQRCLELYEKLVQAQERELELITEQAKLMIEGAALKVIEKEFRAQAQIIKSLEEQNLSQAETIEQLQQQLSLSANADVKPPQTSAA